MAISQIVGARFKGNSSGAAYLFNIRTGQQIAKLLPDFASGDLMDLFGATVAIEGNIAVVGAPFDDINGAGSGAVYLFDAATGQSLRMLLPTDAAESATFGEAVVISKGRILVGATSSGVPAGSLLGTAYVFDAASGQQFAKFQHSDPERNDLFGWALAMDGNTAVFGAALDSYILNGVFFRSPA